MNKFKDLLTVAAKQERPPSTEPFSSTVRSTWGRRPPGKRSHPEFEQITAYIRKDTHHAVKIALLQNGKKEFSQLVEELLCQWLRSQV